jgi:hypothetical protein
MDSRRRADSEPDRFVPPRSNIPSWVIFCSSNLILFLGTFLDVVPCILLIAPILMPVMVQLGMSELQFGSSSLSDLPPDWSLRRGNVLECSFEDFRRIDRRGLQGCASISRLQPHRSAVGYVHSRVESLVAIDFVKQGEK